MIWPVAFPKEEAGLGALIKAVGTFWHSVNPKPSLLSQSVTTSERLAGGAQVITLQYTLSYAEFAQLSGVQGWGPRNQDEAEGQGDIEGKTRKDEAANSSKYRMAGGSSSFSKAAWVETTSSNYVCPPK